ncbi:hypothetical protein V6R21_20260 [Limibacter armeniacum]|uniref:hypothetical protein n=1 Tax=Limibacter armeniacum TaxID=466084 RepID=UPI002FE53F7D
MDSTFLQEQQAGKDERQTQVDMMDFTLTYDGVTQTVEDPRGWDELVISLERDKSTHGVFYSFLETELGFIGQGRKFLRNALNLEGIDAQVMLEIKEDGSILYDGLVDFSTYTDDGTFFEVSIEESSFRQMLKARFKDKVQVPDSYQSAIELHSRVLELETVFEATTWIQISGGEAPHLDLAKVKDEMLLYSPVKYDPLGSDEYTAPSLRCQETEQEGYWKITVEFYKVRHDAEGYINFHILDFDGGSSNDNQDFNIYTYDEPGTTDILVPYIRWELDSVYIKKNWNIIVSTGSLTSFQLARITVRHSYPVESSVNRFFQIGDAMKGVCEQIFGQAGMFTSEALGTGGDFQWYGLMSGFMVRNFPAVDKPFQTSLKELFEGASAIFCLGLGIDNGKVVVERMRHFYDKYTTALTLDYVSIKEEVAEERYWNNVKVGYQKYYEEDEPNANDPICGELEYTTQLLAIENELDIRSKFLADQYMLEVTRRKRYENEDTSPYKHDKETFIVHYYKGEDDGFYSVAGHPDGRLVDKVLSPETLYNFSIIPWENLRRWLDFIKSAYLNRSKNIRLISHEGNIEMREDLLVKTKTDQPMSPYNAIFQPVRYTVESPMNRSQLSQVVAGKYGVVRFSESNQDHKEGFIEKVKFDAGKGMATLQLIGL